MRVAATLFSYSYTPTTPSILTKDIIPKSSLLYASASNRKSARERNMRCRANGSGGGSSYSVRDLDLYEILGLERTCDESQIKTAYRKLQKRCHPDIAGPPGHDMAIILNQVYSILSDPISRFAYDKEQAKMGELRGYTGKPIYSVWLGPESEERAVFVDEVKCVGCLKCALFADKTFAIESVYGRARVVAQWADPLPQIQAAIQSCPVDCISMVDRSDLAALEFLMSKQPRGNVRVGASNTAGERVANIFVDVKKFQATFVDALNKANNQQPKETDLQREARLSAIQAIRSISNWLYWQSPKVEQHPSESRRNLLQIAEKSTQPNINKLREAAAARKQAKPTHQTPSNYIHHEEYWTPLAGALPASVSKFGSTTNLEASPAVGPKQRIEEKYMTEDKQTSKIRWEIPMMTGILAAAKVQEQLRDQTLGKLDEHLGGSFALEIVNSSWLPVVLAGVTWYFICMALMQLAQAIQKRL